MRFTFSEQRRLDHLANGKYRCYFDEQSRTEVTTTKNESGEDESISAIVYTYQAVDVDEPTKATIVDALVRTRYSQSDVEAIMRHKFAGEEGADAEFQEFNAFAEKCKKDAEDILSFA